MRVLKYLLCASVSMIAAPMVASAQSSGPPEAIAPDDIVVTARRKNEAAQDVPLTVNAVSAETIEKLNIRDLKNITSVVPGLALNPGLFGPVVSLRGINVNINSSGSNPTVEFYLNEAPVSGAVVLQSVYDIGQIEVLRGPQGTLRGRASPSGSITITTRRPDLDEWGGYVEGTATSLDSINAQGALNVPIIENVLALRVAGLFENNDWNLADRISGNGESRSRTRSVRASLRLAPNDSMEFNATYSYLEKPYNQFTLVESANLALGTPVVGTLVTARQRASVQDLPSRNRQAYNILNWQAKWSFAGQRIDYVGSFTKSNARTFEFIDRGDFFGPSYPGDASSATQNLQNLTTLQRTISQQSSHEFRLSSEERLFGHFDYIVGVLANRNESDINITTRVPVFAPSISPANFRSILDVPTIRLGRTLEQAVFGNLTFHLGERTEFSGGARYIHYKDNSNTPNNATDDVYNATIWSASAKHRFNENLMVYASAGSSWRLSSGTNPIILQRSGITPATVTDPFLASLFASTAEKSKSYEIGVKSSWFDKKLLLNISAFHQKFDGYIFSSAPAFITNFNGTVYQNPTRTVAGLGVGVPAKVDGFEAEIDFRPSSNFDLGLSVAYAKSKITNGLLPCTPPSPPASNPPTIANIQGSSPTRQVATCVVNQSASLLAPFSASVRSEYSHPIAASIEGFARGLVDFKGNSSNDPQNPFDDVDSYAVANLYVGVRSEDRSWEVTGYVKNLFNVFRVFSRDTTPSAVNTSVGAALSNYRVITTIDPREFGITARFAFGSR